MTNSEPRNGPAFIASARYRVRYRLDGQRADREFVGTYLGWSEYHRAYEFNLRPEAGTSQVPADAVLAYEMVSQATPHAVPSQVKPGQHVPVNVVREETAR